MRMRRLPVPVKLIEADHALDLLETYVAELENPTTNLDQNMLPAWLLMVASNRPKLPLSPDPRSREMSQRCWSCAVWLPLMYDAERCAQTLAAMRARALHAASCGLA